MLFHTVRLYPLFCGTQKCCVQKTGVRNSPTYFKRFRIFLFLKTGKIIWQKRISKIMFSKKSANLKNKIKT